MKNTQSGNVLIYVLIAVALLAALSYAVAQSGRGGVKNLTREKAALYATEIIGYGNTVFQAVSQLRLRDYDASEISFENPIVAGYTNANCTDSECKIFDIYGGGLTWVSPPTGANDGTDWVFTVNHIDGVGLSGTDDRDVMMILQNLDLTVCQEINNKLHNTTVIPQQDFPLTNIAPFTGSFNGRTIQASGVLVGKYAYCFEGAGTPPAGTYSYYQVLIPR